MVALQIIETMFDEAKIFVPDVFEDDRGFFKETYNQQRYTDAGIYDQFVQDSVSFSMMNVLRGLHFQPGMSKLVQVLRGKIFDVLVDVREHSPTYGKWQGVYLSETNHRQLYIPDGFANGFLTLTDDVVFSYKHGALYDPARERAIRWNDPSIGVTWPFTSKPRISAKDQLAPLFLELAAARRNE